MVDDYYKQINHFLAMGTTPKELTTSQKKKLVFKAMDFQLIVGQLYKIESDVIL